MSETRDALTDLRDRLHVAYEDWRVAYKNGGALSRSERYKENGLWKRFKNLERKYQEQAQSCSQVKEQTKP